MILKASNKNEEADFVYDKLLKERFVFLNGEVNQTSAINVIQELIYLDKKNKKDINLIINSEGGFCSDGFAIISIIECLKSKVNTIGMGKCESMAALILCCGTGHRLALPNTRILIHSIQSGYEGSFNDNKIYWKEHSKIQEMMIEILSRKCKKDKKIIEKDIERDFFLSEKEACEYGLIDGITLKI